MRRTAPDAPDGCRPPRRRTTRSRTAHQGSDPGRESPGTGCPPRIAGSKCITEPSGAATKAAPPAIAPMPSRIGPETAASPAACNSGRGIVDCAGVPGSSRLTAHLLVREAITPQEDVAEQCPDGHQSRDIRPCLGRSASFNVDRRADGTGMSRPAGRCWARRSTRRRRNPAGGRQLNPRRAPRLQNVGALVANRDLGAVGRSDLSDARPRPLLHCGQLRQQSGNKLQMAPTTPGHSALIPTRAARTLVTSCSTYRRAGGAALEAARTTCTLKESSPCRSWPFPSPSC